MKEMYVEGEVAFCNLKSFDTYQGKSTDKYTITVTLDEANAEALSKAGVLVKDFQGSPQRKFSTTYEVSIFNPDMSAWDKKEIPKRSKVKIYAKISDDPYKEYGCSTYVNQVQVLEEASGGVPDGFQPVQGSASVETPEFAEVEDDDLPF